MSGLAQFPPPLTPLAGLDAAMRSRGHAVLAASDVAMLAGVSLQALQALSPSWADLPPDTYLKDGGRYRQRRHACYVVTAQQVQPVPPRPHWQPLEYNALHGGMRRWFAPVSEATAAASGWQALLCGLARVCARLHGDPPRWHVEAHQFRITTRGGIGRPTPEGAHRDGVDFVAVLLVARQAIKGGETRVFSADGPEGQRFTLEEPWSLLLLDDARVIHETTPIQPCIAGQEGHRDTLVLTFRAAGFLGDPV
ncbi:MAG: 2OG-Fe dioxygenase family protein [Thermomonas hydrothermalis]|uniref:2OG-Fe dioxygenase family protein n=1 Tax=Thermomonas hydrothermalis TaxID=213588 RepID=UPI002354CAB6|nr:2OG-Fe dioxygenase family protein [Thermomonas hydrothermalis]MCL6619169.1 2OG-Fe dioxygenase family protein [Thermomonas hydrothermalis]